MLSSKSPANLLRAPAIWRSAAKSEAERRNHRNMCVSTGGLQKGKPAMRDGEVTQQTGPGEAPGATSDERAHANEQMRLYYSPEL
ncbi:hypothetical protein AAFF_G00373490 [Aldrovandia affinis]|uniref:Uncharacterized protein n=1 Tax=Aldrovandia affinis TaxID=143900 RepID=A0AAD7SGG4_9TELE|nr:hypothetical protein AAFF_G00373490 [Aldrovandia affinis]